MMKEAAGPHVPELRGLFLMQTQAAGQFVKVTRKPKQRAIVPECDANEKQNVAFLLMERCDCSLLHLMKSPFAESEVKFTCRGILQGLEHLHNRGIIHRDIKPGNILLTDGGRRVVLSDLGLALQLSEDVVLAEGGTRGYRPPESIRRYQWSKASDIFSLGAVVYELLFDTPAFARETSVATDAATLCGRLPELSMLGKGWQRYEWAHGNAKPTATRKSS